VSVAVRHQPFHNEPIVDFRDESNNTAFTEALDRVRGQLGRTYPLLIGDSEVSRDRTFPSTNPARPNEIIGRHACATTADVDAAVAAAADAFQEWSQSLATQRAELLFDVADRVIARRHDFSALMVFEVGKTREEADGEVAEVADLLRWYAHQMLRLDPPQQLTAVEGEETSFFYLPLGVGAIVSPWNFPLALTCGMMSAAVVAGNTVVVKPASASATSVAWLVDLFRAAGLASGVINYITGPGGEIGDALVDHAGVRFVAFTGSKEVGIRINERAARIQPGQIWIKRVQLEMGGKNAIVVDETADLDEAADGIVVSAFGFQGQKCSACSRAVIVDEVYDQLVPRILERARLLRVGDPSDPDVDIGPLIDASAQRKVLDYIEVGCTEGELVLGGKSVLGDGYFVEPTIVTDVAPNARIAQEEIFGPVLTVIRARDFDHAVEIANGTEFGLTGSLFSSDQHRIEEALRSFNAGNLYINRKNTGALMGAHPFGGFNMSGTNTKAGGPDYLLFFLQGKSVGQRTRRDPSVK
jgi:1-pyrroline-5-carboxylate dehydrogenase